MKSKIYLSIYLMLGFLTFGLAQETATTNFWENVRFGGSLGADFSNGRTSIVVAPSAIYQFNDQFALGTSISFGYSSFNRNDTKQYNYGASVLGLYNPTRNLQLSGEFEHTFVNASSKIGGITFKDDFNFPALYLGAGYRLGNISAGMRYDVLFKKEKSIYRSALSPFIRVYF